MLNVFSKGHLHEKNNKQNNFTSRSAWSEDSYTLVVILLYIKTKQLQVAIWFDKPMVLAY